MIIENAMCVKCKTPIVFNPPVVVPPGESLEPKCSDCVSPEELQKQQQCSDEATTFVLAGVALDMYTAVLVKNGPRLTNLMMKTKQVLSQDPNFINRFRTAQQAVLKSYAEELAPPAQKRQPPESLL